MKIQRMFSDVEEDERLYSTGNDELNELLERAFCEGYEYAQKEFGRTGKTKEENKKFFTKEVDRKARRAENRRRAIEEGFKPSSELFANRGRITGSNEVIENLRGAKSKRRGVENVEKDIERASKNTKTKKSMLGRSWDEKVTAGTKEQLENEAHSKNILQAGRGATKDAKYGSEHWNSLNGRINSGRAGTRELDFTAKTELRKKVREREKALKKNQNKLGKNGKIALGVGLSAAAIGTGVAIKKHNDKKKKEEENK